MDKTDNKINQTITELINLFKTENVPKMVAYATHPRLNVPSNKWSLSNRIIQMLQNTSDSRGFKQWQLAGRKIKSKAKAYYIYAPRQFLKYTCICERTLWGKDALKEKCNNCSETIVKEEIIKMLSFSPVPVFKVEDTEGEPLNYENIPVPKHRFIDVAISFGLTVKSISFQGKYLGYYRSSGNEIAIASPDEMVFYHELAHAAHDRLNLLRKTEAGKLSNEIVAEFVAIVLCYMDNKSIDKIGNAYRYLENYAKIQNKSIEKSVMKMLSEIESVLNHILETERTIIMNHESPEQIVNKTDERMAA